MVSAKSIAFDVDLHVNYEGRQAHVHGDHHELTVEVPNVTAGIALVRAALSRGLARFSRDLAGPVLSFRVRGREVARWGERRGLLGWFGLSIRVRPLRLASSLLGM